eukprot:TRINITY_DN23204_c0_g1_i1.p1 TRINITY_DN23204_c0_g1~~TRINITY_DN23204_c0_g1_i1.p1  ORF type:complete len:820 (-),score=144.15 TRINITY_DN23204_c0_g1_i1:1094-3553(-)
MAANGLAPGEDLNLDEEELLESFSAISTIDKAWCRKTPTGKGGLDVVVSMSQRNLVSNSVRKYLSSAHIAEPLGDLSFFYWAPFPSELTGVALAVSSPSRSRLLLVKNGEAGKEASPVKFEIWAAGRMLKEIYAPKTTHGPVYSDGWFEGVSWSADETKIAYVAEEPAAKRPVFGRKTSSADNSASSPYGIKQTTKAQKGIPPPDPPSDAGTWKGQGWWTEDWGERYTGKGKPSLFVLDTQEGTVEAVEGVPPDVSVGQVTWAPQSPQGVQESLVYVGWSAYATNFGTHKRLGMKSCNNRPCALYSITLPVPGQAAMYGKPVRPETIKLTASLSSAFKPTFTPDGALLVFLSAHAAVDSGVHSATNSLHSLVWPAEGFTAPASGGMIMGLPPDEEEEGGPLLTVTASADVPLNIIIDVVPRAEEAGGFPGLYCTSIVPQPWLVSDNRTLLLTTVWRSTQAIIAVHVENGRVSRLTPEGPISWGLLDICQNAVIAGASTPACPTKLMLGRQNAGWLKAEGWLWSEISPPHVEYADSVEAALKSTEFEVIPVPVVARGQPLSEGAKQPFEAIFVRRQQADLAAGVLPPLVVVPHGGPHASTSTTFSMPYAYLTALGFSVLHVNYRGSLGFGEEALQSLPKNIGRQDVADVLAALDKVMSLGYADSNRVAVLGGSHGGFLAAHLIGQVPDRFRTAILRNPVCNLASMSTTSDIPDWCFIETMGAPGVGAYSENPSVTELQAFYRASPITHASKVKVPTLFQLSGGDRRVPASNALQLVHALRAQGLEAKVVFFPEDNHSQDKPQSEFEAWLTTAQWLKKHLA